VRVNNFTDMACWLYRGLEGMPLTAEFKSQTYVSVMMCAFILKLSIYYYIIRHLHVYCISVRCFRHISSTPTSYLESPWFKSWHTGRVL